MIHNRIFFSSLLAFSLILPFTTRSLPSCIQPVDYSRQYASRAVQTAVSLLGAELVAQALLNKHHDIKNILFGTIGAALCYGAICHPDKFIGASPLWEKSNPNLTSINIEDRGIYSTFTKFFKK